MAGRVPLQRGQPDKHRQRERQESLRVRRGKMFRSVRGKDFKQCGKKAEAEKEMIL